MDELIFDQWAEAQGVERPFASLADMPQEARDELAELLRIDISSDDWRRGAALRLLDIDVTADANNIPLAWRDPAQSAYLIGADAKGIQARAHSTWRTLNPLADNFTWMEILEAIIDELGISPPKPTEGTRSRLATEEAYEAAIVEWAAEKSWNELSEDQRGEAEAFLKDNPDWGAKLRAAGFRPFAGRIFVSGIMKHLASKGFGAYIGAVKTAAFLNKKLGTKFMMKNAAKSMKVFLRAGNALMWAWLAKDVLDLGFGHTRQRLVPVVCQIHTDWLLTRLEFDDGDAANAPEANTPTPR